MLAPFTRILACKDASPFPLEEYLVDKGPLESGFFHLVGRSRENSYHGQS
jgi:hypothetical protein